MYHDCYTAAFVMPHFGGGGPCNFKYLKKTINSIFAQSDTNWQLVVVDDNSPLCESLDYLLGLEQQYPDKVKVICSAPNRGPGYCRNIGIRWASEHKIPFIIFIDADDLCHKDRVRVTRQIFSEHGSASVVYSTFSVIDENDNLVPYGSLSASIKEIIDSHLIPPQGKNAWIQIGTETGYTNLTSSTAVRTDIALKYPFPVEKVSEDAHTWLRYSAGGDEFFYTAEIPSLYRIPSDSGGSSSRAREGGRSSFYLKMAQVDESGFKEAIRLAKQNRKIESHQGDDLLMKYYIKQSETMFLEGELKLAREQALAALNISQIKAWPLLNQYGWIDQLQLA